jgi:hypothetical protein
LLEVLLVVAILALTLVLVSQGSRAAQRASTEASANDVRSFVQGAASEMKLRGQVTFITMERITPGGVSRPFWRLSLWADTSGNGSLETTGLGADTMVRRLDLSPAIALSTSSMTTIETTNWSNNAADGTSRYLICDFLGRTMVPGPVQIPNTATLAITHQNMLPPASAQLSPATKYELRISPVWSAGIQRYQYDASDPTKWRKS